MRAANTILAERLIHPSMSAQIGHSKCRTRRRTLNVPASKIPVLVWNGEFELTSPSRLHQSFIHMFPPQLSFLWYDKL